MDALTLLAVVQDLRGALMGAVVRGVLPAGLHGLWIDLVTPAGQDSLLVLADEVLPRLARGAPRPPKAGPLSPLAGTARRVLPGASVQTVAHRGLDRVVTLEFAYPVPAGQAGCLLTAELFGRQPNLILVDRLTGCIIESARHSQDTDRRVIRPEQPYAPLPLPARPDPRVLGTLEAIGAILATHLAAGLGPAVALRQSLAGLTDLWAREIVARAPAPAGAAELARALLDLIQRVEAGPWEPHLLLDDAGHPVGASPVRLRHVSETRQESCASLGEMVERLADQLGRQHAVLARQTTLRQFLRRLEVRLRSRRAKLAAESLEFGRAELSRRMGEILVAHQAGVPRGATEVTFPDHAGGPDATLSIPLDPALSPAANAERLFKAARRGRRGAIRVATRLAETDAELGRVQAWSQRVAEASSLESLEAIQKEVAETPRLLSPRDRAALDSSPAAKRVGPTHTPTGSLSERTRRAPPGRGRGTSPDPRRFVSSDGFPILVGRDTQGNDYLTMHLAKSQDLWLHVQGHAGSHVVVRVPNRSGNVPRRTLIQAAQLAAYYSQARDHGKVAVDYTLRKYVRKPKKVKPGVVIISQEKTIIVSPDKSLVQKLAASNGEA
jgi:predicted ribosome quality control (RQC) complex YloA/Tae2 family protein